MGSSETRIEPLLEARGIFKSYLTGIETLEVLRGTSLTVAPAEIVAIMGESGTGKSTLLHILGALDRPDAGQVIYNGSPVFNGDDDALAAFRNRNIGFVFQFHHLLPEFDALENVSMPAMIAGKSLSDIRPRASELLTMLGLGDRLHHRPNQLSGGEQQRVAVARALVNNPQLVFMDEPTGNLDARTAEALHDEIVNLRDNRGQTFVLVTHNPSLAARADRVLRLLDGQLVDAEDIQPLA